MGRLVMIGGAILALWIALNVYRDGPDHAFGPISALLAEPQYGQADRPSRDTDLADQVLEHDPALDHEESEWEEE
jgi:hypothetical protein